jgi:hypothetical protein
VLPVPTTEIDVAWMNALANVPLVRARQARGVVHGGMLGGQGLGRDDNLPIKKWKGCLWAALPRWARDKID